MSGVAVLSVGASSPIGIDARQTALLLRASKSSPRSSPFRDARGHTIGSIRCVMLDDSLTGPERLIALSAPALQEALETAPAGFRDDDRPVILLLCLAEPFDHEDELFQRPADLLGAIAKTAQLRLDERSEVVRLGHAGFAALLARAATFSGDVRVIVGAVDSYHDAARMKTMDDNYRILSGRAGNGFIPSEAACFVCVAPLGRRTTTERPLSIVRFVACAEEEVVFPPVARALSKLTRDERLPRPVPWVVSDMNGENHREREWTIVRVRNSDVFDPNPDNTALDHPYQEIGELGAATGAVYLAYVSLGFRLGFARHSSALIVTSSEGQSRAIFYVEAPE